VISLLMHNLSSRETFLPFFFRLTHPSGGA